jgi:Fic family protein
LDFTPIIPTDLQGVIDSELLELCEEVCIKSAALSGSHNPQVLDGIKELLRKVNSYYSNKIESEGTHPLDIDKALNKEFSSNQKEKKLQILSLAHIEVQRYIENSVTNPFSQDFILSIHKALYDKPKMQDFLQIEYQGGFVTMTPGVLRQRDVKVGSHVAPAYTKLPMLMNAFETLYKFPKHSTQAEKLIYAFSSHHRLTWIHPFLDGNGRVARLALDGVLLGMKLEGYGLWNISRGLARESLEYKKHLASADIQKQGEHDGRGVLTNKGLKIFVRYMLKTALDQVNYMGKALKLETLNHKIEQYVKLSALVGDEPLPKYSLPLFKELLICGELPRGKVKDIIGTKDRTASTLIKELIQKDFLESNTPKSPIKLKFNAHFASYLFPELVPQR